MTIYASIHGRTGTDPVCSTTAAGKDMTRLSIAVDVTGHQAAEAETQWITAVAFGRVAEQLARAAKGEMITAQGKLTRSRFTGKDGVRREGWSLLADGVIVARSARPTEKTTRAGPPANHPRNPNDAPLPHAYEDIPF